MKCLERKKDMKYSPKKQVFSYTNKSLVLKNKKFNCYILSV